MQVLGAVLFMGSNALWKICWIFGVVCLTQRIELGEVAAYQIQTLVCVLAGEVLEMKVIG